MSDERKTVDGFPVKVGDRVWTAHPWGLVKLTTMQKHHLGMWWDSMVSKQIYSTESAALDAAIATKKAELKKAKQEIRSAAKAIERLTERKQRIQR